MNEDNKIKVNDLPAEQETEKEVELPVLNKETSEDKRGGHSEGGCCGACGG